MPLDRRRFIGLIAASTTTLAGCGGGIYAGFGSGFDDGFTSFVWVLNLNPEFASADVSIGPVTVALGLPPGGLTARSEFEAGQYDVALRDRTSGAAVGFDDVRIHEGTLTLQVFFRDGNSSLLTSSPTGITNYFDSSIPLDVDLFDDGGVAQNEILDFEDSADQASRSGNCTLRIYPGDGSNVLVYDSGLQQRTDAILIFPRFPAASPRSGEVAVIGLNYGTDSVSAFVWPNLLG
ncbi:MAG TPA: hypothetical protein VFG60_03090 [Burkholderiaceae bacterium]|nr:hypothetical protein [Burkholderiaceae bacterium]